MNYAPSSLGCSPFLGYVSVSVVVDLLFSVTPIITLFVGVLCQSLFFYEFLFVPSSFAIILTRKRELVACFPFIVLLL